MSRVSPSRRAVLAFASLVFLCSCAGQAGKSVSSPTAGSRLAFENPREARRLAEEAVAADPDDANGWYELALAWQADTSMFSHADSASVAYERLLALEPDHLEGLVHYGLVLEDLRKYDDALVQYRKAVELAPDDPLPRVNLGSLLYFHFRKTYEAKTELVRALEIDPNSADAHFNLGVMFADANMFREAKAEWDLVMKIAPEGPARSLAAENLERIRPLVEGVGLSP